MFIQSILLFEDEPLISCMLQLELEGMGFAIFAARTLDEALAICQEHLPDLAIINFRQQQIADGMSLARLLRLHFLMPAVIITGARSQDMVHSADFYAGQEVLHKPFSLSQLRKTLQHFIAPG